MLFNESLNCRFLNAVVTVRANPFKTIRMNAHMRAIALILEQYLGSSTRDGTDIALSGMQFYQSKTTVDGTEGISGMDLSPKRSAGEQNNYPRYNWGPWLFRAALIGALVFFWWLLIYGHGVTPHE